MSDITVTQLPARDADTVYADGVLIFDATSKMLYIGDGVNAGGRPLFSTDIPDAAAVPEHIHALPRKSPDAALIYPEGVVVYHPEEKRMYVGDGVTPGGTPVSNYEEMLGLLESMQNLEELTEGIREDMVAVARQQALLFG